MKKSIKRLRTFFFTLLAKFSLKDYSAKIKVNGFSYFTNKTKIGKNSHFNGFKVFGIGKCTIGDNFHSGFGCKVLTSQHNYKGNKLPYDESYIVKDVNIGNNVWFGIDVTILPGVKIGDGVIVQAGSLVVKDIPPLSIVGGVPAVVFSKRDSNHYKRLIDNNNIL